MNKVRKIFLWAIDPDTEASGVAFLDRTGNTITTERISFAELVMERLRLADKASTEVVIEGGWLNEKSAFHRYPNARVA